MSDKIETVGVAGGKQHPTYKGVLAKAHEEGLKSIETELLQAPLESNKYMAIVKATVITEKGSFSGIGDATPKNVTALIAPHIVRMAETRAKGRALRDALNIGEALKEEMGGDGGTDYSTKEPSGSIDKKCNKCNGEMVNNPKTGKWFCKDKCWLKKKDEDIYPPDDWS